jgi:hypothetical protein
MKVNIVQVFIAIAICLLIAYGFYALHGNEYKILLNGNEHRILLSCGSFLFLVSTLITAIGIRFSQSRTTINIRVVSGIFFFIALISNIIFSLFQFSNPTYILTNGILLFIFILIVYSISKTKV